jgi:hypothetical protein
MNDSHIQDNTILDFKHLSTSTVQPDPFKHFRTKNLLSEAFGILLLDWFETHAPWQFSNGGFYRQYELNLYHVKNLPQDFTTLLSDSFKTELLKQVSELFKVKLLPRIDIDAIKLVPGYQIGIHTDYSHGETHRLLIYLNRHWVTNRDGGILMFFDEPQPVELRNTHRYYEPNNLSGIGFEISEKSFHAVSEVKNNNRYTLRFSFYEKKNCSSLELMSVRL